MRPKIIGAGMLAICPETERFLMLKRRYDMEYPGYWNYPGGSFDEKDGYPKVTALREFREETGYKGIVKISKQPLYVYKTNHLDFYTYAGVLPFEFVPNMKGEYICGEESLDFGWFPVCCRWGYDENILPPIIDVFNLKRETIKKIINKFKNKNYE